MQRELFEVLARCIEYPGADWKQRLDLGHQNLQRHLPDAARHLARFRAAVGDLSATRAQELFTRTFDHNPAHALEIGWHLFGEDYHRGALLVRLRRELRKHHISESLELPDHLSHVLLLLGTMTPSEATEFATACVLPALRTLLDGLHRDASAYTDLIRSIHTVLEHFIAIRFEEVVDGRPVQAS